MKKDNKKFNSHGIDCLVAGSLCLIFCIIFDFLLNKECAYTFTPILYFSSAICLYIGLTNIK